MKRIRQFLIGMVLCAVFLSGCTSSPVDPYKLLQEARQAAEEGDWQQALQKYDRLVELSPDNGEVYNGRGAILLEQGNMNWHWKIWRKPWSRAAITRSIGITWDL